jgi:hypothetical protein
MQAAALLSKSCEFIKHLECEDTFCVCACHQYQMYITNCPGHSWIAFDNTGHKWTETETEEGGQLGRRVCDWCGKTEFLYKQEWIERSPV